MAGKERIISPTRSGKPMAEDAAESGSRKAPHKIEKPVGEGNADRLFTYWGYRAFSMYVAWRCDVLNVGLDAGGTGESGAGGEVVA